MANVTLTNSLIARTAVIQLDNNLVMAKKVYRGYEKDFDNTVNGYETGDTISVRRPMDFTVRDGAVLAAQDTTEGKFNLVVNKRKGVDFSFTSQELSLDIKELDERIIKPAMIQLANQIDSDLHALYSDVSKWVGTPGQKIDSFADLSKGMERLDDLSIPTDGRCAVLTPSDHWGMVGNLTGLFIERAANPAYRKGTLGEVGGVQMMMAQNNKTHTTGTFTTGSTPLTNGAAQETTYVLSKDANTQTLITDGWAISTLVLKDGDVFTIANVFDVNAVTKATLDHLKQFTVVGDQTSSGAGALTLTMTPAAISTGAHQTVSATIADGAVIAPVGTEATGYRQNMMFTENAFALVTVPLVSPPGAVDVSRQSYKGTHVRMIPVYDGTNDISRWRTDVLYGVKTIDERCATRVSGTA